MHVRVGSRNVGGRVLPARSEGLDGSIMVSWCFWGTGAGHVMDGLIATLCTRTLVPLSSALLTGAVNLKSQKNSIGPFSCRSAPADAIHQGLQQD